MSNEESVESDVRLGNESPSALGRILYAALMPLLYVYFIGVMIAAPYYNWCYARDHGFVSWICLGEVVATFQSLAWPYYALAGSSKRDWTDDELDAVEHFHKSSAAVQQAIRIANSGPRDRPSEMTAEEAQAMLALYRLALTEARQVDPELLVKGHADFPTRFKNNYLPYLELMNRYNSGNGKFSDQIAAHKLFDEWVDWFNANADDIHLPKARSR